MNDDKVKLMTTVNTEWSASQKKKGDGLNFIADGDEDSWMTVYGA